MAGDGSEPRDEQASTENTTSGGGGASPCEQAGGGPTACRNNASILLDRFALLFDLRHSPHRNSHVGHHCTPANRRFIQDAGRSFADRRPAVDRPEFRPGCLPHLRRTPSAAAVPSAFRTRSYRQGQTCGKNPTRHPCGGATRMGPPSAPAAFFPSPAAGRKPFACGRNPLRFLAPPASARLPLLI